MEVRTKRPLKRSSLNFLYLFDGKDQKAKWLAELIKDELIADNVLHYVNFDFINIGTKTFKSDEFCKDETFQNANVIFIEKNCIDLIEKENLVGKEVNILDRISFEVTEKLAGTYNDFYDNVYGKIKKYINNHYGGIRYFSIADKETCRIRIADNVTATCIMRLENHCFTEHNKDDLVKTCKDLLEKAITTEKENIEHLKMILKDSEKKLEVLNHRLGQIDSEIEKL